MVKTNIDNRVGLHYNRSCLIPRIRVWVYGVMDTMYPPLLTLINSDFSVVGKYILNSEKLLLLPWVLELLHSLISGPSLSWLMCLPPFYIFLQLLRSFFVLVLFLLYWAHDNPTFLSDMLETLTFNYCYCLLEYNDDSPVIQLWCTVYLYAYNRSFKRAWSDEPKSTLIYWLKNYF